ncbi:MAG: FliM/FliN family flagellar motor switch protein [Solirubrobacterales bacterium]|nr:FliM/FliN family flagellar motor switch protein [Solirubrobacterales bacterium]
MSTQQDITPREALMRLGASTAESIAQVLEMFAPGAVKRGEVTVLPDGASPFSNVARGSIASSVSYVDGVTGANIFVLTPAGARGLATAMGAPPPETEDGAEEPELSELEMSAIAEAANQTMAAAAAAISVVLGQEVEISTPDTRVLDEPSQTSDIYGTAPHATSTTFLIAGESCRLIQLIPAAFVVRMVRAMDEMTGEVTDAGAVTRSASGTAASAVDASPNSLALQEVLGGISLRVWAELGRARMPLGSALGLPVGAVLDLDHTADAPVDLYVNGMRFARAQLLVTEDGEWAVSLESLENEGLRLLEKARAARPEGREDVDPDAQAQDSSSDLPIEKEGSSTDPETPEADAPGNPETPDVKQTHVEGAVT